MSPSSRAEWVEIITKDGNKEGAACLRPRGRSGLKFLSLCTSDPAPGSPSSRAEWVEIWYPSPLPAGCSSPSSRAEWVEIWIVLLIAGVILSPSSRAEWVEISFKNKKCLPLVVSVLAGGVG